MKCKKLLAVLFASVLMIANGSALPVFADEISSEPTVSTDLGENEKSTGLIISASLSITSTSRKIYINANTIGSETMSQIGFKSIEIQRSLYDTGGWTTVEYLNDDVATDTKIHSKSSEQHSVTGGYYYRVKLEHYAKETGWFFPSSQSITNYSNVIWVPN